MRGIEIKTDLGKKYEKKPLPFVALLLLEAGVFGILLFVKALDNVDYQTGIVLSAAAAVCCVIWYCYRRHKVLFWGVMLAAISGCVLGTLLLENVLRIQTAHMISSLQRKPELGTMQITETAMMLAVALPLLLFVLECLIKSHTLIYVLTTMLLLTAPFLGVHTNMETVFLLILFQMAFWVIQAADARKEKRQLFSNARYRLSGKIGAVISIVLVIIFCIALPLVLFAREQLYDFVYDAEGFVYRSLNSMSGRTEAPVTGGKISRSNNYPTGTAHLELMTRSQPTQALYLRGFGGGEYIGGDWIRSSDEALFENITKKLGEREWLSMISNMYYNMYFVVNENMLTEEAPEAITLSLQPVNSKYRNRYVPYYSQNRYSLGSGWYVYRYYEQKDMNIDWGNIHPDFEQQKDWYMELQQEYIEQAQEAYTQVPKERLPRLTALVEENPLTELDEISAFILYTLHSNATYTLTPGWSVFNEDVVEYFLFERKKGFCEHFAVTATLMYRLYGIPARYATGYMVSPSDFEPQEDGSYLAVVTDEDAHAWVEIFLEDYGWTPVEVTPAGDGSTVTSYPGFDGIQLNQIWRERGWDVTSPSLAEDTAESLPNIEGAEGTDFLLDLDIDWEKYRGLLMVVCACLVYSVLLLPLFLDYRRMRILRKAGTVGCRATFYRLMQMLHFGGVLTEYDGSEEDFADFLAKAGAGISKDEAGQLISVVSKAAFGPVQPDKSEEAFVRRLYRNAAVHIYEGLSRRKKLIFKYIKAYV